MKKTISLFSMLLLTPFVILAQDEEISLFQPAIIAGFNATQVDGDDLEGFRKIGANVGAAMFIMLPKNFSVSFELLYSQKGSKSSNSEFFLDINGVPHGSYKLVLDYIDVPIMANYHDKKRAIFGLGFVYTSLVRYKEFRDDIKFEYKQGSPYKKAGLEIVGSITFLFAKKFGINFRYTYSLINLTNRELDFSNLDSKGQKNNVLSLRGMYFF